MTPEEYCYHKAASSGSSFYYSFFFLPARRRKAITALYAYCREVDDVVDETPDPRIAELMLSEWRTEIERLFSGSPQHLVTQALLPYLEEFDLQKPLFLEIIAGMEMDLLQTRYTDFEALSQYCYRVASVVGLLSARIFGQKDEKTSEYAELLGKAFQLTNICRDIAEDAARGRIYLPQDELTRFDVSEHDILDAHHSENFKQLMLFQVERANDYYAKAMESLPTIDKKSQRPGLIMAAIYYDILRQIKQSPDLILSRRLSVSLWRKLVLAGKTWFSGDVSF